MTDPIPLLVSNKKAYVWDVDGVLQTARTPTSLTVLFRYRETALAPSHLRHANWNTSPPLPTKRISWRSATTYARGGGPPRPKG